MRFGRLDPDEERSPARLGEAVRIGVGSFVEEVTTFLVANVAWAVAAGSVVYAVTRSPIALVLLPLIAPLTTGLARVATEAARQRVVSPRTFVAGVRDRFWTKVGLGALQAGVIGIALLDVLLAPAIGGLPALMSIVLAIYIAISSVVFGMVFWTLLADATLGAMPVRQLARLALAVILRKPLPVLFLLVYTLLAVGIMTTLVAPVLFLPSIILLTIAAYVIPAAEEIRSPVEVSRAR